MSIQNLNLNGMLRTGLIALIAVYCILIYTQSHDRVVLAGDYAPDFSITTDTGQTVSPASFGGKVLILNFWATWCVPCREEIPSLNQLSQQFRDHGLVVLAISIDENLSGYNRFLEKTRPRFLTARDPDQNINREYGTFQIPETYIIDARGKVIDKVISNRNWMDSETLKHLQHLL